MNIIETPDGGRRVFDSTPHGSFDVEFYPGADGSEGYLVNEVGKQVGTWRVDFKTPQASLPRKVMSLAQAIATAPRVSQEVYQRRLATCAQCDVMTVDCSKVMQCCVCGCNLGGRGLRDLARYKENLPKWGCKHPKRGDGQHGWTA